MCDIWLSTKEYSDEKVFDINGVSYAGNPKNNTALFIGKKVEKFVLNLFDRENCLVFIDKSIDVPKDIDKKNLFVKCENPQYEYALFTKKIENKIMDYNKKRNYKLTSGGYYIGENVTIGKDVYIANNVFIDHDVIIGSNVKILSGARLSKCIIGNNCTISENAIIGSKAPNIASFNCSNVLIPMLGNVVIENNVYVGVSVDIPCAMASSTIIKNSVIIGTNTSIGHDDFIGDNTIIAANTAIGGYTRIGRNVYIGLGANIKNRITVGDNVYVCMGSVVIRDINDSLKVFGNPAKKMVL